MGALKHLTALCDAGIVVKKENPNDLRQPLFALSPEIAVAQSADVLTVNLGCGTLRFANR